MQGKRTLAGQVNTKTASITDFKIDKAGPTIDITLLKQDGSEYIGNWINSLVNYSIKVSDDGCGSISSTYMQDNTGTKTGIVLSADGSAYGTIQSPSSLGMMFVVYFYCFDGLGNQSSKYKSIYYDFDSPILSNVKFVSNGNEFSSGEWVNGSVGASFIGTIREQMQGLSSSHIEARESGSSDWGNASVTSLKNGKSSWEVCAVDGAGNRSNVETFDLWVDMTNPRISVSMSRFDHYTSDLQR